MNLVEDAFGILFQCLILSRWFIFVFVYLFVILFASVFILAFLFVSIVCNCICHFISICICIWTCIWYVCDEYLILGLLSLLKLTSRQYDEVVPQQVSLCALRNLVGRPITWFHLQNLKAHTKQQSWTILKGQTHLYLYLYLYVFVCLYVFLHLCL